MVGREWDACHRSEWCEKGLIQVPEEAKGPRHATCSHHNMCGARHSCRCLTVI